MNYPEVNIARRIIEQYQLEPPIDIMQIVAQYATLSEVSLPVQADGIVVNLKKIDQTPQIFINKQYAITRKRFTAAHELGHVLIPWHVGTIVSHIDESYNPSIDPFYQEIEREANRFASELLTPTSWLKNLINSQDTITNILRHVSKTAQVSLSMSCISLLKALPPGYQFVELHKRSSKVVHSGASAGTLRQWFSPGDIINPRTMFAWANKKEILLHRGNIIIWWYYDEEDLFDPYSDTTEWRDILQEIFYSLNMTDEEIKEKRRVISGMIGYAYGRAKDVTPEELYKQLYHRFISRENLLSIVKHPKFKQFLIQRSKSLLSR